MLQKKKNQLRRGISKKIYLNVIDEWCVNGYIEGIIKGIIQQIITHK